VHSHLKKGQVIILLFVLLITLSLLQMTLALNFGDQSPDSGEADSGRNTGTFNSESGSYTNTQTEDNTYYAIERKKNTAASANQTLLFNASYYLTNTSLTITAINGTISYCHAQKKDDGCDSSTNAEGTPQRMYLLLQNSSSQRFITVGELFPTLDNTKRTANWSLPANARFTDFINSSGFITLIIPFLWNGSGRSSFLNDHTNLTISSDVQPSVFLSQPAPNYQRNGTSLITFVCNATDDLGLQNMTLYLGRTNGNFTPNITTTITGRTNTSQFNQTLPHGDYTWGCSTFDTRNPERFTSTNATIHIATNLSISTTQCTPAPAYLSQTITCNATVLHDADTGFSVAVNLTYPNTTIIRQTLTNQSTVYSFSFISATQNGTYAITWAVNDSTNNTLTNTTTLSVSDGTAPTILLTAPENGLNTSQTTLNFTFNAQDNLDPSTNCTLLLDQTIRGTNTTTLNAVQTLFSVPNIDAGAHTWNIRCNDYANNTNTSVSRNFTIDLDAPQISSFLIAPTTEAALDPGVLISVNATVTERTTTIHQVLFQYKLNTTDAYTSVPMTFSSNVYTTIVNLSSAGGYNLRIFANDTVGNTNISAMMNISVYPDTTWNTSTLIITKTSTRTQYNDSISLITIQNTGDTQLHFSFTSNYSDTTFNPGTLTLNQGTNTTINITLFTPDTNTVLLFNITINATPDAHPSTLLIQANITLDADAFLNATFIQLPSAFRQDDKELPFTAQLRNSGQKNATNITFTYLLPEGWINTSGNTTLILPDLGNNATITNPIKIHIPLNATLENITIQLRVTGQTLNGTDLRLLGNTYEESVNDTIQAFVPQQSPTLLAADIPPGRRRSVPEQAAAAPLLPAEILYTTETIPLIRQGTSRIPIQITNKYPDTTLEHITIQPQGPLRAYIHLIPFYAQQNRVITTQDITTKPGETTALQFPLTPEQTFRTDPRTHDSVALTFDRPAHIITLPTGKAVILDAILNTTNTLTMQLTNLTKDLVTLHASLFASPEEDKIYYAENRTYALQITTLPALSSPANITLLIQGDLISIIPAQTGYAFKNYTEYRTLTFYEEPALIAFPAPLVTFTSFIRHRWSIFLLEFIIIFILIYAFITPSLRKQHPASWNHKDYMLASLKHAHHITHPRHAKNKPNTFK